MSFFHSIILKILKQNKFTALPLSGYMYTYKLLQICRKDTEFVITVFSYIYNVIYKEFEVICRNPSFVGRSELVGLVLVCGRGGG
jgi:hypothetical protein